MHGGCSRAFHEAQPQSTSLRTGNQSQQSLQSTTTSPPARHVELATPPKLHLRSDARGTSSAIARATNAGGGRFDKGKKLRFAASSALADSWLAPRPQAEYANIPLQPAQPCDSPTSLPIRVARGWGHRPSTQSASNRSRCDSDKGRDILRPIGRNVNCSGNRHRDSPLSVCTEAFVAHNDLELRRLRNELQNPFVVDETDRYRGEGAMHCGSRLLKLAMVCERNQVRCFGSTI